MTQISKEEWSDWKNHVVTRAFFSASDERVEDAKEILSVSAGLDSDNDNFYRGFIQAYTEMRGFRIEDLDDA
jgi:hypothetical protein